MGMVPKGRGDRQPHAKITLPKKPLQRQTALDFANLQAQQLISALRAKAGARMNLAHGRAAGFVHGRDYRKVSLDGLEWSLGPMQARVVAILHRAIRERAPWRSGKRVLEEAGSSSACMSGLFKRQPRWRDLIKSDGRGFYRLNTEL